MHDMLRIMDVASALRRERETAESQLDLATAKARLRERLLATAQAAGEPVTAAEVDAAIEQYFAQQHVYADPPPSLRRLGWNAWVLRVPIALLTGVVGVGIAVLVAFAAALGRSDPPPMRTPAAAPPAHAPSASAPAAPTPAPTADDRLENAHRAFEQVRAAATALAADDDARARVEQVARSGTAAHAAADLARLQRARDELDALVARLDEQFTVTVVDRPGEKSGVDRYEGGRLSGYYVIVEARTADGKALPRTVRNAETGRTEQVTKWGEQVPDAVWQRLVADKTADGVVDDAVFATKERGRHGESVVMLGADGKPLRRGRQITRW
jgi:hypothetical protein